MGLATVLLLALATGVVSAVDLDVEVEGEPVEDGDEVDLTHSDVDFDDVEVFVTASSDLGLSSVMIDHEGKMQYAGVIQESYSTSSTIQVGLGSSTLTVTAEDSGGSQETVEVTLTRDVTTEAELTALLQSREKDLEDLEDEIEELESYEANLTSENERLKQEVNETDADDGEGLPGFSVLAALVSLALAAFVHRGSRAR